MTGANKEKALLYSRNLKRATVVHEMVHDVLNSLGHKALYWNEPFVTMLSNVLAEKSGLDIKYLESRKKFNASLGYAVANFPWKNISQKDVSQLVESINKSVARNKGLQQMGYANFNKRIAFETHNMYFDLLERKLSSYSVQDKNVVRELAIKGLEDCKGRKDLVGVAKRLQRLVNLTG